MHRVPYKSPDLCAQAIYRCCGGDIERVVILVSPSLRQLKKLTEQGGFCRKGKGRDIGYALATRSCEEANSVEACTITALDAITAFAVPNPNHSSQNCRFFQVWLLDRLPYQADHPIYFGLANCCLSQPFRSSTVRKLNR